MYKYLFFIVISAFPVTGSAQTETKRVHGAVLRNLVVPGWGHQYAGVGKTKGRAFIYADAALIISYLNVSKKTAHLEGNLEPFAVQNAGVSLQGKDRSFVLAVTNHASLQSYNQAMTSARQWNALLSETPSNQWEWTSENERIQFARMRDRHEIARQNTSALLSMLIVNRVVSAVSVYSAFPRNVSVSMQFGGPLNTGKTVVLSVPF